MNNLRNPNTGINQKECASTNLLIDPMIIQDPQTNDDSIPSKLSTSNNMEPYFEAYYLYIIKKSEAYLPTKHVLCHNEEGSGPQIPHFISTYNTNSLIENPFS